MLATTYQLWTAERQTNPNAIVEKLISRGMAQDYFIYTGQGESRIVCDYLAKLTISADQVRLELEGAPPYLEPVVDPFKQAEHLLSSLPIVDWTAYGYVAFDIAKFYYPYIKSMKSPLMQLIIPKVDIRTVGDTVSIHSSSHIEELIDLICQPGQKTSYIPTPPSVTYSDRQSYCDRVETITRAIRAGKLQKAILSRCVHVHGFLDLLGTYTIASESSDDSSRPYCFTLGQVNGVGCSPEILLEANRQGTIVTNPLAGTRPRGVDPEEDRRLRGELFTDAKEVKEHAISILLAQEEINSVCSPDTVRIYDFMDVKEFHYVKHLSSRVSGTLYCGNTVWDALKALFPAVTVSGIKKDQALQYIGELEAEPRGIYGGAVGWIDSYGGASLAIAIRSAFQYGSTIHINAGAGIVAESIPEREYLESVNKMKSILNQIRFSSSNKHQEVAVGLG